MRALGASGRLLAHMQRAELLAGVLASLAAMAVGWALAHYLFEFSWNPSPWVPLVGRLGPPLESGGSAAQGKALALMVALAAPWSEPVDASKHFESIGRHCISKARNGFRSKGREDSLATEPQASIAYAVRRRIN